MFVYIQNRVIAKKKELDGTAERNESFLNGAKAREIEILTLRNVLVLGKKEGF